MFECVIRNGSISTANSTVVGDIGISSGLIREVGPANSLTGVQTIDATGMHVVPGAIDVHVHLELPFCGTVSCDDFESGSRSAACGGVTTVIDFAIPSAGGTLLEAHDAWMKKARGRSLVDFSWHMAITRDEHLDEIGAMIRRGLPTFKEFMIYEAEGWNSDDGRMFRTLEAMADLGGMLLVHAESSRVLNELIRRHHVPELMREHGARLHTITRPNFVEAEAIERAIHWSRVTGGRLYVVHMSTAEGADLVAAAQRQGVPVLAETCAQYLCLDDSVFSKPDGHLFACCPQVKGRADIERLWHALTREVSVVSTDTCSFTREQKGMWMVGQGADAYGDWTKIPMGLPGLDTLVPLLYTLGVESGRITLNQLVSLVSTNPARIMGLSHIKGDIRPGMHADLAIIDPEFRMTVSPERLQSRCDWSPFDGMNLAGFSHTTLVRGVPVVRDHAPVGNLSHGRFVERRLPDAG